MKQIKPQLMTACSLNVCRNYDPLTFKLLILDKSSLVNQGFFKTVGRK